MAIELHVTSRTEGSHLIIDVAGELDLYTSPTLRERIIGALEDEDRSIVVDLRKVGFMDSTALGVLVSCLKRVRERGGGLALVMAPDGPPRKVLSITGLDEVFTVHDELPAS